MSQLEPTPRKTFGAVDLALAVAAVISSIAVQGMYVQHDRPRLLASVEKPASEGPANISKMRITAAGVIQLDNESYAGTSEFRQAAATLLKGNSIELTVADSIKVAYVNECLSILRANGVFNVRIGTAGE